MSLNKFKLPNLRDKHNALLTNEDIEQETKKLNQDTKKKKEKVAKNKNK